MVYSVKFVGFHSFPWTVVKVQQRHQQMAAANADLMPDLVRVIVCTITG
jgi:hypothetical protein